MEKQEGEVGAEKQEGREAGRRKAGGRSRMEERTQ